MLLEIKNVKSLPIFTPQKWQTVILRNYGIVSNEIIAKVLKTDEKTIQYEAVRLGLEGIKYNDKWIKAGYITIIRNNWHLLPYSQLLTLLDMTEEQLDFSLREDDFLGYKLGGFKPQTDEVYYSPLNLTEIVQTEEIAQIIRANFLKDYTSPFDFFYDKPFEISNMVTGEDFTKIVYGYSSLYGDAFFVDGEIVDEKMLRHLQKVGVNGLWFQGVLSKLSPYPFVAGVDKGYQIRRKNLQKLIAKCARFGIKVYLYFNEPRAIEEELFTPAIEGLKGGKCRTKYALCSSKKETKEYLYNATKDLLCSLLGLGGIITITMSENYTNCYSLPVENCPLCNKRSRPEVVAEVNNIIMQAIKDSGSKAKLLVNLWGWAPYMHWTREEVFKGISLLDKDAVVMCVSEFGTIKKDGKPYNVGEYSISRVGPCEETKEYLAYAKETGHKIFAKVQVNNSWEFAIVPFIPVYELIMEHMVNLKKLGIKGLMLSWTLGGYPSVSLQLVNSIFSDNFNYEKWLETHYGDNAEIVKKSVALFSEGFRHYPFNVGTLYNAPQHVGASNLWYFENTELKATMVCYPYDDFFRWKNRNIPDEEFEAEIEYLLEKWQKGQCLLNGVNGNCAYEELKRMAEVIYVNMRSLLVQFRYNKVKNCESKATLLAYLEEEWRLTKRLYSVASKDARIGYEASNHYYFTQNNFLEKLINLNKLKKQYLQ